eukprot:m.201212 g.201212  ORF g.201212 m.201212 type:complete len:1035 (+) comp17056_c0_seq35:106-3210(+)
MAEPSSPKGCKHPAFMSHDWGAGNINHKRVVELAKNLQRCGLPVWIDEQEMTGDIATKMCKGIQDSDTVVVCLTERYMKKVNGDNDKDNCKLEFDYAAGHHGKIKLIPVVMEKAVSDTHAWTDSIGMYLKSTLYVKMWDEDDVDIEGDGFLHLVKEIRHRAPRWETNPPTDMSPTNTHASTFIGAVSLPPPAPTQTKQHQHQQPGLQRTLSASVDTDNGADEAGTEHVDAQSALESQTRAALDALTGAKVPYNGASVVSVGPGGTGKTQTRLSITGHGMMIHRQSTVGSDEVQLRVRLNHGAMVGFQEVDDEGSQLQQAVAYCLANQSQLEREAAGDTEMFRKQAKRHAEERRLAAENRASARTLLDWKASVASRSNTATDAPDPVDGDETEDGVSAADISVGGELDELPRDSSDSSGTVQADVGSSLTEEVTTLLLQHNGEGSTPVGVRTLFCDMGGQPELWALVAGFLRNQAVISVYFRLDELLSVIDTDISLYSDSHMNGLDELFVWLDAVVSTTTTGPVLLVGTFADKVGNQNDQHRISKRLLGMLQAREHPLLVGKRLVRPDSGNGLFFPVDNTLGLADPGLQAYKAKLETSIRAVDSVKMPVPLGLVRFQDAISSLARPPATQERPVIRRIRDQSPSAATPEGAGTSEGVPYIRLADARMIYEDCLQGLDEQPADDTFQHYLDFLHLQGVITHDNEGELKDLVVIKRMWLLKTLARVIRCAHASQPGSEALHALPGDDALPAASMEALFTTGILRIGLLEHLWPSCNEQLRMELMGIMLQSGLCVTTSLEGDRVSRLLVPSLLPAEAPPKKMRFLKTKITQRPPPHTVLIVTYTGELLYHEDITQSDELIPRVTMPIGLFEQLVGRLIQQSSDPYWNKLPISRGFAAVCLQDLLVTLEPHASGRMIQVQLYANNVSGLLRQVTSALNYVMVHYYKQLRSDVFIPVQSDDDDNEGDDDDDDDDEGSAEGAAEASSKQMKEFLSAGKAQGMAQPDIKTQTLESASWSVTTAVAVIIAVLAVLAGVYWQTS